jgi:PAS domain S-box-containing protein
MSSAEALSGILMQSGYHALLAMDDALLEAIPAALYICSAEGVVVRFNRRASDMWGRSPRTGDANERFCGAFRLFRLDGALLPHSETPMAAVLRTGQAQRDKEVVLERPDGSRAIALVNVEPLIGPLGEIQGAINCFHDISDRKKLEEEHRTARDELEDFFENAVVAMHWVGPDGTILRANKAELDLLGYSQEQYVGRHIAAFHADRSTIEDILARLARGETLDKFPARLIAKDNSIKDVLISSSGQFSQGRFVRTRCITLDVTEERLKDGLLRDSERRYQDLLQALPAAVYTTDAAGRITFYNEAAADLWGHRPELGTAEWCGSWKLYWPDGTPLPHEQCPMAIALKEQRPIRGMEAAAERPDGTRIPFIPYPTPIFDNAGALAGAVNMLVDISERRKAETAVRRQTERLETLNRIARNLSSELDLERVVQAVTDSATELSGARFGAFFYNLTDEEGERYQLYTLSGAPRDAFDKFGMPRNTAVFAPTFSGDGILRCDDIRQDPRYGRSAPHFGMPDGHLPVVSYLAVPVVSRSGEIHGGLFFGHEEAGVFTQESEEIVAAIAAHAAIAIDNARLLEEARREVEQRRCAEKSLARRIEEQAALYQLTDSLHRAASREQAYAASLDAIQLALGCDRASILLFDDAGVMRFVAWRDLSDGYRDAVEGHSPWTPATGDAQPVCVDDVDNADIAEPLKRAIKEERIGALAFIPLVEKGKVVGKFMTYYDAPHVFTNDELNLALTIARQLGFTVNRFLAEEARRRIEDELRQSEEGQRARAAELQAIMEAVPAAVWIAHDAECRTIQGNRMSHEILRLPPDQNPSLSAPEGERPTNFDVLAGGRVLAPEELPVQRAARGEDVFNFEEEVRFNDGSAAYLVGNARPLRDERGKSRGAVAAFVDITDRKQAELAMRDSERRLQLALEAGRMGAWEWDANSGDVKWSPGLEEVHGLAPGTFGGSFDDFKRDIHPEDLDAVLAEAHRALATRGDYHVAYRIIRPDETTRWVEAFGSFVPDPDGMTSRLAGVCMDITERRQSEEQLSLVVAELSHRVKNTLATVMSIARQSFAKAPSLEVARVSFDARIHALAQTHGRLAETNWSGVSLETLLLDELAPYGGSDGENVRMAGPTVILKPKCALTLGLAIHELATNAAKYGAFSSKDGTVEVDWHVDIASRQLHIRWTESGGPPVAPPGHKGFGRLLLERALVSDLRGEVGLEFAETGLRCLVVMPTDGHIARIS